MRLKIKMRAQLLLKMATKARQGQKQTTMENNKRVAKVGIKMEPIMHKPKLKRLKKLP